jgi:hypothetical protein
MVTAAFGEVQFFFQLKINNGEEETVALTSVFGNPDPRLLQESSGALIVCEYQGNNSLEIIPVKTISTCIAMILFKNPEDNLFFVCSKMGLDVAFLGGAQEVEEEDDYNDMYL